MNIVLNVGENIGTGRRAIDTIIILADLKTQLIQLEYIVYSFKSGGGCIKLLTTV